MPDLRWVYHNELWWLLWKTLAVATLASAVGNRLHQHLSLKPYWTAQVRINDPGSCGSQKGYLLVKFIVVSKSILPFRIFSEVFKALECQQA